MKIVIASIGKSRNSNINTLYQSYTKRINWQIELKELEVKESLPEKKLKQKETDLLLSAVAGTSRIIALDENGKIMSSAGFARQIGDWCNQGVKSISFLIGGAAGHDTGIKDKANLLLSFGKMTWPHMLVRPMIAEQLYRACTILNNHPYHR